MSNTAHYVKTNIAWTGSGADGDPWRIVSWDVELCECDNIMRHGHLA